MSGHRQAAVALHGLAEEDRELILAELPPADRATLQDYLRELNELGFEGGPAIASLAGDSPDRIADAPASALAAVFEHEPASLLGQFLALRDWRWRDELLQMLPATRRAQVSAVAAQGAPAPARARYLLAAVERRLAQTAAPVPAPRLSLVSRWVRAWTR